MKKRLFADKPHIQRIGLLRSNSDKVKKLEYQKRITSDQLNELKDSLVELNVHLSKLEGEKKEYLASMKSEMKPMKEEISSIIDKLNSQTETVEEECYKFIDQEEGEVNWYNDHGELILSRKIYPNERQLKIHTINK